jgi:ATP-dependent RNA helicase RhlE
VARGIDVEQLSHVVNFDVPNVPDDYIHRVGRTARADATGDAFTFVSPDEEADLRAIERSVGRALPRIIVPGFDYTRRPAERFEVPIGERIAAIRSRRADERKRAKEKAERRAGRGPSQTATAQSPSSNRHSTRPAARPAAPRQAPRPSADAPADAARERVRGAWSPARSSEAGARPRGPDVARGGRPASSAPNAGARPKSGPPPRGSVARPSGGTPSSADGVRRRRRRGGGGSRPGSGSG